jgi:hypothetical protein
MVFSLSDDNNLECEEALDVFVVSSPYQALSALQARLYFNSKNCLLIVSLPSDKESKSAFEISRIVELSGWGEVIYVYPEERNKIVGALKRRSILKGLEFIGDLCCRNFFIGDFRVQWMHYLKNLIGPKKVYILDDGAASISIYENYLSKGIFYPEKNGIVKQLIERFLYFPFFDKKKQDLEMSMFTSYSLDGVNGLEVIKSDFLELKRYLKVEEKLIDNGEVWFFGSPYSERCIIKEEREVAFVKSCLSWLISRDYRVFYVPHRFESEKKLKKICKLDGVLIKRLDLPAEAYFILSKKTPGAIAACYSSVLETLPKIQVMHNVFSFVLPVEARNDNIINIYSYYRKNNIKVVDLIDRF